MLPNEVFALECIARYAKEDLVVDDRNGYFAHCPYPKPLDQVGRLPGDLGYYLTFFDHQHQGLLQSVDVGRKCYFAPDVRMYLDTWSSGCFDLWDIYNKFNKDTEEQKKAKSERMSGEKHPQHGKFGASHPSSRAIIAIKPDGTELHFGSGIEAARELGMKPSNLGKYARRGHVVTKGPRKGYQFFFAEQK